MHVGMYDCMRSASESELGNQLSGILRKENKQTCILVPLCVSMIVRSESESASPSSPPQLKRVRVTHKFACCHDGNSRVCESSLHIRARARVCPGTISLISLLRLVCLPVPTVTQNKDTHTRNNTTNTGQCMSSNHRTSTLSLNHTISVLSHEKHAHSPKR